MINDFVEPIYDQVNVKFQFELNMYSSHNCTSFLRNIFILILIARK